MLGSNQNFTEEQIRALIFSLNLIGQKNSGSISVNSLNEASEIIAYIAGFSSWKQLRNSLRKGKESIDNYDYIPHPKHISNQSLINESNQNDTLSIEITFEKLAEIEKKLKLPKLKFSHEYSSDVIDIEQMATGHLIVGSSFDSQLKYEKIYHINPQNTLCTSSNSLFFNSICKQAYKKQKHIIEFTHLIDTHDKTVVKLDPLNEVYTSENFDKMLQLDFDSHHGFDFLWSLLIKNHCQSNNYIINTTILKNFLSLEFLTLYALTLKKNKNPLSSLLDKYLLSLKIRKEEKRIIYQNNYVIEHLKNINNIYLNILHLEELYNNGTFSYQSHQLINNFINRQSIVVYAPLKLNDYSSYVFSQTLEYCTQQFDIICENKNYSHSHYNTLIINSNPELFKLKDLYLKNYSYHFRMNSNFDDFISLFQQIIFGKIDFLETPKKEWLMKFFLFTPDTINIFALGNKLLRECDENSAFLWKTNENHPILAHDLFEINEIDIYAPEKKLK